MRKLSTLSKVVLGIAALFLFLTCFCCTSGLVLSLFVDKDTLEAMAERHEARQAAAELAADKAATDKAATDQAATDQAATAVEDRPRRDEKPSTPDDLSKSDKPPQPPKFVMPSYTVLDTVKRLDGNKQVEVLVASFTADTLRDHREKAARQVAKKEKADIVLLFSTTDAQKAVYSDAFSKANPSASSGYLGRWTQDGFKESEQ